MNPDYSHALDIINEKRRRLRLLNLQAARSGNDTKPDVLMEIEDLQKEIPILEARAEQAVSGFGLPAAFMGAAGTLHDSAGLAPRGIACETSLAVAAPTGLLTHQQTSSAFAYQNTSLVVDAPPIPPWIGRRTKTVSSLIEADGATKWLAFHGSSSRGKTLLCRLIAESLDGQITWVQFAGLSGDGAAALLEQLCSHLSQQPPPPRREEWYRLTARAMGSGAVLVLDDIPDLARTPQLRQRLAPLVRECVGAGAHVLSASLFPIPGTVLHDLDRLANDQLAPTFSNEDVEEVLYAFGAPPETASSVANVINTVARQHPTLIIAACRYMQTMNWELSDEAFEGLFRGAHATDLAAEVHSKLKATVPDLTTRELLYRLKLVNGAFRDDELDALASAPPPITVVRDRLQDVMNSWVEAQPDGQWIVSPLLSNAIPDGLDAAVRKVCHRALAEVIVGRGTMNQYSALRAITHFHQASEFGKAGSILLLLLNEASQQPQRIANDLVLEFWTTTPIPQEMDLNLRLTIRGFQIAIFHALKRPLEFLFSDLDSLIAQATAEHRFGLAGAVSYVAVHMGRKHPIQTGKWLRHFLAIPTSKLSRTTRNPKRKVDARPELVLGKDFPLHTLIWLMAGELDTPEKVEDWLTTVHALSPQARGEAFEDWNRLGKDHKSHVSCVVVAESLVGAEQGKPQENRNWDAVAGHLTRFATRARELKVQVLWAAFIRAKITVQGEWCRDIEGAITTAAEASKLASGDSVVGYLIDGAVGRQALLVKRYADAKFWLGRAVGRKADRIASYEQVNILTAASHAFGIEDPRQGVKYAQQAAEIAEGNDDVPVIEKVRAWSELGVAQYLAEGVAAAFDSWHRAATHLYLTTERDNSWKEMIVLFGHVTGYFARVAESGNPPTAIASGEAYAPPVRGIFMLTDPRRMAFFNDKNESSLWRIVAYYADALGKKDAASKWKSIAVELGRAASFLGLVAEAERDDIVNTLRERGYMATLVAGRKAAKAMLVFHQETKAGRPGLIADSELDAEVEKLDDGCKLNLEEFAMLIGLIPCILHLAAVAIRPEPPSAAQSLGQELANACRSIASESFHPHRWQWAAEIIERSYVRGELGAQIVAWGRTLTGDIGDAINFILRIAASANAGPQESLAWMLAIMPRLCGCLPATSPAHRELLTPFVVRYWNETFEKRRFNFSTPKVVEMLLPEAVTAPEPQRVPAVFRAIYAGFSFRSELPEEVRQWLYGSKG